MSCSGVRQGLRHAFHTVQDTKPVKMQAANGVIPWCGSGLLWQWGPQVSAAWLPWWLQVVVLDVALPVKQAFHALHEQVSWHGPCFPWVVRRRGSVHS